MWQKYRKTAVQEMRPYTPGEDLTGISVSAEDTPEIGGMIARNPDNPNDQWYVAKEFFAKNYEVLGIDEEVYESSRLVDLDRICMHENPVSWDVEQLMVLLYCISQDVEDGVATEAEARERIAAVMARGTPTNPAPVGAGIGGSMPVYVSPNPVYAIQDLRHRFGNEFVTELAEAIKTESR